MTVERRLPVILLETGAAVPRLEAEAGTSSLIRNCRGYPRGISGMRPAQRARSQATRFGTRLFTGWPVTGLDGAPHVVHTWLEPGL